MLYKDIQEKEVKEEFKVGNRVYNLGTLPVYIIKRIQNIPTVFSTDTEFISCWKDIIKESLELWNTEVDISIMHTGHIIDFISIISSKNAN